MVGIQRAHSGMMLARHGGWKGSHPDFGPLSWHMVQCVQGCRGARAHRVPLSVSLRQPSSNEGAVARSIVAHCGRLSPSQPDPIHSSKKHFEKERQFWGYACSASLKSFVGFFIFYTYFFIFLFSLPFFLSLLFSSSSNVFFLFRERQKDEVVFRAKKLQNW